MNILKNNNKTQTPQNIPNQLNDLDFDKQKLERSTNSITDIIAPASVEVDFGHIRVGDKFYRTYFVVGYPRFVSSNWLEPLIDFDGSLNVSMFCYPSSSSDALDDIKRKNSGNAGNLTTARRRSQGFGSQG